MLSTTSRLMGADIWVYMCLYIHVYIYIYIYLYLCRYKDSYNYLQRSIFVAHITPLL